MTVAAQNGHDTVVARLLAAEAAIDHANSEGATPLTLAAQNGHDAVVACLLAAGAIVDGAGSAGQNALNVAAQHGHSAIVARLLAGGVRPPHSVTASGLLARTSNSRTMNGCRRLLDVPKRGTQRRAQS
jgi:ankyrin repeat protein